MAELLDVSRSGYYAWAARRTGGQPGPRACRRTDLTVKIRVAHDASNGVYGSPRIVVDLREGGEVVSRKTVAKLMAADGIRGISPRRWRPVTIITDTSVHAIPDLLARRFDQGVLARDGFGVGIAPIPVVVLGPQG
ncbi:IS3 family transposase [Dermatophilaceae bacterium Sec6.4]